MKKYVYKHLTQEMQDILTEEIKKVGRDILYDQVEHNIWVSKIQEVQNRPDAFKKVYKGCYESEKWKVDLMCPKEVVMMDNLTLEMEMLHFIDTKRFLDYEC